MLDQIKTPIVTSPLRGVNLFAVQNVKDRLSALYLHHLSITVSNCDLNTVFIWSASEIKFRLLDIFLTP